MHNIALCGKARSGKDTVAAHLVEKHGYTRLAFADPLKDAALALDPVIPYDLPEFGGLNHVRLSVLVDHIGWDRAKAEYPEVRRTLQRFGQGVRNIDEDFWINALLHKMAKTTGPIVVTDMRYANEFDALECCGFQMIRVVRPGAGLSGAEGAHDSETALDHLSPHELRNYGSLELLHARVDALVA